MQILVDVRLLCRGGTSGIEEYTRNLLGALLDCDSDNNYLLFYNGLRKKPINLEPRGSDLETRVLNWKIPNKLFDLSTRFLGFPAIDRFIKTDIVFSPHFNILKTADAPRVITFHDLSFVHHPQFFSRRQRFWHWLQNVKQQVREADRIIAVSEFTKSDLVNLLGAPPEKITVIYSGISEKFGKIATPTNSDASELVARNDGKPYILYLGTLEPRKNVPAIIRAFNILKQDPFFRDWQLVLAGRPGWLYKDVIKEADCSPYRNDIIFKGAVRPDERVSLYNLAEVFVYPSFFEGFGFPPLEAQACGCPVVASDRTSLPEVLGESALLVNPWRAEELTAAIKKIVADSGQRDRLVKSGFANAARFDWQKTAKETLKIFKSFV